MALEAKVGQALLHEEIKGLGEDAPLTRLRVPLETGIDPGDCYNQCAYEKGYSFVCYLRHLVGSDEVSRVVSMVGCKVAHSLPSAGV